MESFHTILQDPELFAHGLDSRTVFPRTDFFEEDLPNSLVVDPLNLSIALVQLLNSAPLTSLKCQGSQKIPKSETHCISYIMLH